jgi:Ca2+-binding EF-hand superfamily protein
MNVNIDMLVLKLNLVLQGLLGTVEAMKLVYKLPSSKSGNVEYSEFETVATQTFFKEGDTLIVAAFRKLDTDNVGTIVKARLMRALMEGTTMFTKYSKHFELLYIQAMNDFDDDKEGTLEYIPFKKFLISNLLSIHQQDVSSLY